MPLLLKVLHYKGQPIPNEIIVWFDESGGSIGRSPDNNLVLPDPARYISGKHARIVFRDKSYLFSDTSANGTYFINRGFLLRQGTVALRDGERLKIGDYEIKVAVDVFLEGLGSELRDQIKDEDLFADLVNHQLALTAGIQAAIKAALLRFDPGRYEKLYSKGFVFQKQAKCWDTYAKAYPELVNEVLENFFGKEFREAYERQIQMLQAAQNGQGRYLVDRKSEEQSGPKIIATKESEADLWRQGKPEAFPEESLFIEQLDTCESFGDEDDRTILHPSPERRPSPYGGKTGWWSRLKAKVLGKPSPEHILADFSELLKKEFKPKFVAQKDEVHLAVSAPRFVKPNLGFVARFAAYIEEREAEVRKKLEAADRGRADFIPQPETCRWKQGTPIQVRVIGDCFTAVPAVHSFEWDGREAIKSFQVRPKPEVPAGGTAQLGFEVWVAGFPEAWLWVEIEISNQPTSSELAGTTGRPARRAFASYASADLPDVLARISAVTAWDKGLDIFYSWLDLVEGEDWQERLEKELSLREVLLLFWSRNAKASKWVDWEWRTVLHMKGLQAIQPIPIEPPEIAAPPEELAPYMNFRDRFLVAREAALRIAESKAQAARD